MNPRPSKLTRLLPFFLVLALQAAPILADTQLQGEIRFNVEQESPAWLGQQLELYLDIWSDGLSFGDQLFVLPEVKGAYFLQADSSTVKLNEDRGGIQWLGLRYTFFLYPQRAGRLEVPSFGVRFSARAGYRAEAVRFEFQTPPVFIDARLPPGADSADLVVTTTSFAMEASWKPELPVDDPVNLRVGDAITLEVTRRAQEVPGMVFAPLPEFSIDGLRSYPAAPRVNDEINRGALTGTRTDSITFICEGEGDFRIPELRFAWWNPTQEVLSEKVIPARELTVVANPAYAAGTADGSGRTGTGFGWKLTVVAITGLVLLIFPGRWLARFITGWLRQRRVDREAGEPWAFGQVRTACASGNAIEAYNAITVWLSRREQGRTGLTLMQWAMERGDEALLGATTSLQESVASGLAGEWSGGELARLLVKHRRHSDQSAKHADGLHPLNPSALRSR